MLNRKVMPICLALGMLFASCSKEKLDSPNQSDTPSKAGQEASKSTYTDEEKIAMAGNIKKITYVSGTIYDVDFYGGTATYNTEVTDFYTDSLIVLIIDDGTTKSTSTLDILNDKLDIQNDAVYNFSSLDNDSLHSGSSVLFRVTLGLISHHMETPRTTANFNNNGSSDVVPDNLVGANCFWCTEYETDHSIGAGLCTTIATPYFFWFEGD